MSKASRLADVLAHVATTATVEPGAVRTALREAARQPEEAREPLPEIPTELEAGLARLVVATVRRRLLSELRGLQMLDRRRLAHVERLLDGLEAMENGTAQPGAGFRMAAHVRAIRRTAAPPDDVRLQQAARLPGLADPDRAALAGRLQQLAETQDAALAALIELLDAAGDVVGNVPGGDADDGNRLIA